MHREQLVVKLRRHLVTQRGIGPEGLGEDRHRLPRPGQLPADGHRQQSAQHEEDQAREQELNPNDLVIMREDILEDEVGRRGMDVIVTVIVPMVMAMFAGLRVRRRQSCRAVARCFRAHSNHLPSCSAAIVSWLRFCSASFSSSHF